jgi:hypothetical protein
MHSKKTLESLLASIRAGAYFHQRDPEGFPHRPVPFITISRQAGAGGTTLAAALEARLNSADPGDRPWATWDHDLVRKVALEQHVAASLVESLDTEGPRPSWFREFLSALTPPNREEDLDEFQVFRRTAITVRTLALLGRCIIVGRGGVYATSDLAHGVHVRLVAPLPHRIARLASLRHIPEKEAAAEVHRIDCYRDEFHRRYWPEKAMLPEIFTITLNAALVGEDQMVDCIVPLVGHSREHIAHAANVQADYEGQ